MDLIEIWWVSLQNCKLISLSEDRNNEVVPFSFVTVNFWYIQHSRLKLINYIADVDHVSDIETANILERR